MIKWELHRAIGRRLLVVMLGLGLASSSAWAFYNPTAGRWLNRDPIGEPSHEVFFNKDGRRQRSRLAAGRAGPDLYGFVANSPITHADRDGREVFAYCPVCLQPLSPFESHKCPGPPPADKCLKAIAAANAMIGNVSNDERAHCIASCEIAKACGKFGCKCLGDLKEGRDLFVGGVEWVCSWVLPQKAEDWLHDHLQGGNVDDSAVDYAANNYGMDVAARGGDCVRECEKRFGPGP